MNNTYLENKLRQIVHDRGQYTAWPNMFFVVLSIGLLEDMLVKNFWMGLGLILVTIGSIIRIYLVNSIDTPIYKSDARWKYYHLAIIIIGLGWGANYIFVHIHYGLESNESLYSILILSGLLSGGITTLSPSPKLYYSYIISALLFPMAHFLYDYNDPGHLLIVTFMIIFCLFHFYHSSVSYNLIKQSILNDQNLIEQRDKIQALINAVPGFVSFIDEEMKYQTINEYGKMFYDEVEIIGKQVGHIHPKSIFSLFVKNFMQSSRTLQTEELQIEVGNKKSWFVVTIKKIETHPKGAVIVSVPINELVNTRKDLEAQQAKAHYAAKLASLGEMAASIAHEINNPLAIIQGSAEQISRSFQKNTLTKEKGEQLAQKITDTTERISKIVRSLKTLSRNGDKDPFIDFHLKDAINDCVEITRQNFFERQIKLEVSPIPHDLIIQGQQIQISQVLMNLINNAFHAVEGLKEMKWIRIEINTFDHYVELKIIDSGPGIPELIRDKIMVPFFTTKDVGKGTGLGLSISKAIIENHGGSLKLDEKALNTTFVMTLPRRSQGN